MHVQRYGSASSSGAGAHLCFRCYPDASLDSQVSTYKRRQLRIHRNADMLKNIPVRYSPRLIEAYMRLVMRKIVRGRKMRLRPSQSLGSFTPVTLRKHFTLGRNIGFGGENPQRVRWC